MVAVGTRAAAAGGAGGGPGADGRSVRSGTPADIGTMLAYSRKVIFVPGYGLAVAQAQHTIRDLAAVLENRGVEISYAIHPVAGRMPGHMNVLLAEADDPHEQLKDMERANPELPAADVALVVGANDVVNPAARDAPGSPIYGMPIIEVNNARTVMVIMRSLNPGFAGIDNPLFYMDNTLMLFGDAKSFVSGIVKELFVDYGDHVKKGQVLAELDKEQLRARAEEAHATLQGAEAALLSAKAVSERNVVEAEGPDVPFLKTELTRNRKLAAAGVAPPGPVPHGPVPLTLSPGPRRDGVRCPLCGSADTALTAAFSGTACKALYQCLVCLEPFEHVKEF